MGNGMELHIKDLDPHSISAHGGLEDVSQVEKYVMADDEYDKMKNTVRAIKREREAEKKKAEAAEREANGGDAAAGYPEANASRFELSREKLEAAYPIGGRCEVDPGARR